MINQIKNNKIAHMLIFSIMTLFGTKEAFSQSKIIDVDSFDEVIISPHIEVVFKEGEKESVTINELKLPMEKFNIEVKNNTLHIFLDDAKITTKTEKVRTNRKTTRVSVYNGTQAKITVVYKNVETYSLRGEEKFFFESALEKKKLIFNIYGASEIYIKEAILNELKVTIYGESSLEIKNGKIENQKFTAYGESNINTLGITNQTTKITTYGDGKYEFNVTDLLQVTSYGDSVITYKGSPRIKKGLIIGGTTIIPSIKD